MGNNISASWDDEPLGVAALPGGVDSDPPAFFVADDPAVVAGGQEPANNTDYALPSYWDDEPLGQPSDQGVVGNVVDTLQHGAIQGAGGALDFVEADAAAQYMYDWADKQRDTMSPDWQASLDGELFSEEGDYYLGKDAGDLQAWAAKGLDTLGMMAIPIPGGAITAGVARVGLGLSRAAKVLAKANNIPLAEARLAVSQNNKIRDWAATTIGYGGAEGVVGAGLTEKEIRERIIAMDQDVLDESPLYQEVLAGLGGDSDAARMQVADKLSKEAGWEVFVPTAILGTGMGRFYDNLLRGGGRSRPVNAARGALGEALQEAPQSAVEAVAGNRAMQQVDKSVGLYDDLVPSMLEGAALGGAVGGTIAGAMPSGRQQAKEESPVEQQDKSAADYINQAEEAEAGAKIDDTWRDEPVGVIDGAPPIGEAVVPAEKAGRNTQKAMPTMGDAEPQVSVEGVSNKVPATPPADNRSIDDLITEALKYPDFTGVIDAVDVESEGKTNVEQDAILKQRVIEFLDAKESLAPAESPDAVKSNPKKAPPPSGTFPFQATHGSVDGEPLMATDEAGVYLDSEGGEVEDSGAVALSKDAMKAMPSQSPGVVADVPKAMPDRVVMRNGKPFASFTGANNELVNYPGYEVKKEGKGYVLVKAGKSAPVGRVDEAVGIDLAAHEAATSPKNGLTEPSTGQKKAGNYKKGHVTLHGLDVAIENPKGSVRSGTDPGGKPWSQTMRQHYGYIKRSVGKDGDQVDVFLGSRAEDARLPVFVIDQVDPKSGRFDEHKVMMGFKGENQARRAYNSNYAKGWKGLGSISKMSVDEFKGWLKDEDTTKPVVGIKAKVDKGKLDVVLAKSGRPFQRVESARRALRNNPGREVVEVDGGFVLKNKAADKGGSEPLVKDAEAVLKSGKGEKDNELRRDNQSRTSGDEPGAAKTAKGERGAGELVGKPGGRGAGVDAAERSRGGKVKRENASDGADKRGEHGKKGGRGDRPEQRVRADKSQLKDRAEPSAGLQFPAQNYRINPDDAVGQGGAKTKARQNLAAIRILKTLESDAQTAGTRERPATPDEQAALVKYVGWGASELANGMFPVKGRVKKGWEDLSGQLRALLTADEFEQASRSTQYAHYTSPEVISGIYDGLSRMGFEGGVVMEPGMGVGHFAGLMPAGMASRSHYTGIEFDAITAGIAKYLYPESNIQPADFTRYDVPPDHFDLVIGNPPFSSAVILSDPRYKKLRFSLHEYFFAKSIDSVRPGGLQVFVTSRYLMDRKGERARQYLMDRADLLGAIRLPQTAFKANAGTEVVTDILFLKKRAEGDAAAGVVWDTLKEIDTPGGKATVNGYFADHPDMVLGEHALTGSMYGREEYTVNATGDIGKALAAAVKQLPEAMYRSGESVQERVAEMAMVDFDVSERKNKAYYLEDGQLMQMQAGGLGKPVKVKARGRGEGLYKKQAALIADLVPLKEAVIGMLDAQVSGKAFDAQQVKLNQLYDAFVAKYGAVNKVVFRSRKNKAGEVVEYEVSPNFPKALMQDPDAALLATIDSHDPVTGKVRKKPILTERILEPEKSPKIETATDALAAVLNDVGRVDMTDIAEKIGMSESDVVDALGDLVYRNPVSGEWETQDEYLSGHVRDKLRDAVAAAKGDVAFGRNVKALEQVQPVDIPPSQITTRLGASWVPADDVVVFAREVLGLDARIDYNHAGRFWALNAFKVVDPELSAQFGTQRRDVKALLDAGLNQQQVNVYDRVREDGKDKQVLNSEQTELARAKLMDIKAGFERWIWQDGERAERLARKYNDRFNDLVPRRFDGSHLALPGVSTKFTLRPHQKRVVWRIIQSGNTYMAHTVGSGKTMASIAAGMEQRRLGMIRKPMYVVPNHMLKQFSTEFLELYPAAKILVADEESFHTKQRAEFVARSATDNWDGVVITHSAFGLIKAPGDFESRMLEDELQRYKVALEAVDEDQRATRKRMEKLIENMEQRLSAVQGRRQDEGVSFEQLGVDMLFVDEAHEFRKLSFATSQGNVKGIDPTGSAKAWDLYVKSQYLDSMQSGRSLVLMSGTPVTNTMGEMFTLQRFLQRKELERKGLDDFDSWSAQFADTRSVTEQTPSGGYKVVTRLARFVNMPELLRMFRDVADAVRAADLDGYVVRPVVKGGAMKLVTAEPTDAMRDYQGELGRRMEAIERRKGPPKKGDDILLTVITDGRHAALDDRYIDSELPSNPGTKLNLMIDRVYSIWDETKGNVYHDRDTGEPESTLGAAQMIFADLGVSATRGFSAYDAIKQELVAKGVPADDIAYIRDYKKASQKLKLFADLNSGRKRILIGSSRAMGTGVNAQQRLIALHHLDAPWYPADMEQRRGRMVRQGNKNKEVLEFGYAAKGTYDSTMFTMLETKQRFIDQMWSDDFAVREMDDLAGDADQYALAKALSSGDERLIQKVGLEQDVARLQRLRNAHADEQVGARSRISRADATVKSLKQLIGKAEQDLPKRVDTMGDAFSARIDGRGYKDRKKAGAALFKLAAKLDSEADPNGSSHPVGKMAGFDVTLHIDRRGFDDKGKPGRRYRVPEVNLEVAGVGSVEVAAGGSPLGLVQRLENQARKIEDRIADWNDGVAQAVMRKRQAKAVLGKPFDREVEFREKLDELTQLDKALLSEESDNAGDKAAFSIGSLGFMTDLDRLGSDGGLRSLAVGGHEAASAAPVFEKEAVEVIVKRIAGAIKLKIPVAVHATEAELFAAVPKIEQQANEQDATGNIKAVYYEGAVHVVSGNIVSEVEIEEAMLHEGFGHFGLRRLFSGRLKTAANELYTKLGGFEGIRKLAERYGVAGKMAVYFKHAESLPEHQQAFFLVDELVAHLHGEQVYDSLPRRIKRAVLAYIGAVRQWLRDRGFAKLTEFGDADLMAVLARTKRAARVGVVGGAGKAVFQVGYHGSPHEFDKFSIENIGSGEGNQSYGYGHYFSERKKIAEWYRETLSDRHYGQPFEVGGKKYESLLDATHDDGVFTESELRVIDENELGDLILSIGIDQALKEFPDFPSSVYWKSQAKQVVGKINPIKETKGALYKVNMAPKQDEYLLWDKPLSEQSDKVRSIVDASVISQWHKNDVTTGGEFYRWHAKNSSAREASEYLKSLGIRGIKYLDGSSRAKGEGSYNYVIFGDADIDVTAVFSLSSIDESIQSNRDSLLERAKQWFKDAHATSFGELLGALTFRQLAEVGGNKLPQLKGLVRAMQNMQTARNIMADGSAKLATRWQKLSAKVAQALADMMHVTTIAEVDPSVPYAPIVDIADARKRVRLIEKLKQGSPGEVGRQREQWNQEQRELRGKIEKEKARKSAYAGLKVQWDALDKEAQVLFTDARDAYTEMSKRMEQAIIDRIEAADIDKKVKVSAKMQVRKDFEQARLEAPYFPLQRFGKFYVMAKREKGVDKKTGAVFFEHAFFMFDNVSQRRRGLPEIRGDGWTVVRQGKKSEMAKDLDSVSEGFVADTVQRLRDQLGATLGNKASDVLYQSFLGTMPFLSNRVKFIHRKKTPGYSGDALRAFSFNMAHQASQVARMEAQPDFSRLLGDMGTFIKESAKDLPGGDVTKLESLQEEAQKRYEWLMNPQGSPWAAWATTTGFVWYLGLTPAAALVNLSQTAIIAFPELSAKFGVGKSFKALNKALVEVLAARRKWKSRGDYGQWPGLSEDERKALKVWHDSGEIDVTEVHMLLGLAESESTNYNPKVARGIALTGAMFQEAEVVNREATLLAGYRLARDKGMSHVEAVGVSAGMTWNSHYDYSNANRARWMQSNAAKVLLLFRSYSQHTTFYLWRNFYQSMKGESAEVKAEARKRLMGVLGMTGLFAGSIGMPLMGVMFTVANAAAAMFGDDDEPWDAETEWRNLLADYGAAGQVVDRGVVNTLTGANVSSRVSLNDLWFRGPNRDMEGKALYGYWLAQAMGPLGGIVSNLFRAVDLAEEGNVGRALESATPKAIKDGLRALRYADEGVLSFRGDPVVPREAMTPFDLALQAVGFTPDKVAAQWDANSQAKLYERRLENRRRSLVAAYALAYMDGDRDGMDSALRKVRVWNRKHRGMAINQKALRQSIRTRLRYSQEADAGLHLKPKTKYLRDETRVAGW